MCKALCLGLPCPGMGLSLEIAYGQQERGMEKEAVATLRALSVLL